MTTIAELEERVAALEEAALSGDPSHFYRARNGKKASVVDVQEPRKLTDADIKDISGDDGKETAENSANRDVAEALKEERAKAKNPPKK